MARPTWLTTRNILTGILVFYLLNVWVGLMLRMQEPQTEFGRFLEGLKRELCKEDLTRDGCEAYRDEAFCKEHPRLKGCRRFLWWRY